MALFKNRTGVFFVFIAFISSIPFHLGAPFELRAQENESPELKQLFAQMDNAAKDFRTFSAKITEKKYIAILKEFDEPEAGVFLYAREKDGSPLIRIEMIHPKIEIVTVKGNMATVYLPTSKQATKANIGKIKNIAGYMALGIGQSPSKLKEGYFLSLKGTEAIDGIPCSVLELKPKDKKHPLSAITMWIKKPSGLVMQYKFLEPNNDYRLERFSEEKLNAKIPDSKFEQNLPGDVDIQHVN